MNYRTDIQALRGVAVLLVVFYHARLIPIQNGFLGVDIFFVVSGFLITSQISTQLNNKNFSFQKFYLRRAWRLLPAAYTVLFACCLLAPWTLSYSQQQDFVQQIWGAITLSANFVLWDQVGYFEGAAKLKPLLHTWSLSIEEQYYLLMPALLVITPKKYWFPVLTLLSISSYSIYLLLQNTNSVAAFYFTPSRLWELGVGSVLALGLNSRQIWVANGYSISAALLILLSAFYSFSDAAAHTFNLTLTVILTALLIAARPPWLNHGRFIQTLAKVGTISYSLYLVHWPIIAFFNNANISGGGLWWPYRLAAVGLSLLFAVILYKLVEARYRIIDVHQTKRVQPLVLISILLIIFSIGLSLLAKGSEYSTQFRANVGLSEQCSSLDFYELAECRTTEMPTTLLWGDSYAMHLAPGLRATTSDGIMQATLGACAPILEISLYRPPSFNQKWANDCINFNQKVFEFLNTKPSIQLVVLASPWTHIVDQSEQLVIEEGSYSLTKPSIQDLASRIASTVVQLQTLGKKVVVVSPPPTSGFAIAKCHERKERGQWKFDVVVRPACKLNFSDHKTHSLKVSQLMSVLTSKSIPVYFFDDKLCDKNHCETKLGGVILYRDRGHLSYSGSEHYAKKFEMFKELESLAK